MWDRVSAVGEFSMSNTFFTFPHIMVDLEKALIFEVLVNSLV